MKMEKDKRYYLSLKELSLLFKNNESFVAPSGKNLVCIPAFTDIVIDGDERTAIKLIVEAK
jgi:stage V sporulation protein SpoVS